MRAVLERHVAMLKPNGKILGGRYYFYPYPMPIQPFVGMWVDAVDPTDDVWKVKSITVDRFGVVHLEVECVNWDEKDYEEGGDPETEFDDQFEYFTKDWLTKGQLQDYDWKDK